MTTYEPSTGTVGFLVPLLGMYYTPPEIVAYIQETEEEEDA